MLHFFNILISNKHFGAVFHNLSLIFCGLCWIFKNSCPGVGFNGIIFCPRGRCFALSLCLGGGNSPFQKIPQEEAVVRLGID